MINCECEIEHTHLTSKTLANNSMFSPPYSRLLDTTTRSPQTQEARQTTSQASADHQRRSMGLFSDKISYAFQLATAQGPLCSEPIQGIAVLIEDVSVTKTGEEELGRFTGEVIKSARDAVWQGFLDWSPRLLLAMYSCEIQASSKLKLHRSHYHPWVARTTESHYIVQKLKNGIKKKIIIISTTIIIIIIKINKASPKILTSLPPQQPKSSAASTAS